MCVLCDDKPQVYTNSAGHKYSYVVNNGKLMTTNGKPYWFYAQEEGVKQAVEVINRRLTMKEDPTKQAGNRRRAIAELRKRLRGAQEEVLRVFNDIPVRTQETNRDALTVNREYIYELSPERVGSIDALIRDIINRWFETSDDQKPPRFFFDQYIGTAYQTGTVESANRIGMLAQQAGYAAQTLSMLQAESILMSTPYRRRLQLVYGRTFNEMKGFSGQTATDLARVLADVVSLGQSPRKAQTRIRDRFGVAESRAERIARTEINNAYTSARLEEMESAEQDLGIAVRVIHRSALISTTRPWHASRHGKLYTIDEQREFWSQRGNLINCLCSVSEAVLDDDGKPYDMGLMKRLKKERESWTPVR